MAGRKPEGTRAFNPGLVQWYHDVEAALRPLERYAMLADTGINAWVRSMAQHWSRQVDAAIKRAPDDAANAELALYVRRAVLAAGRIGKVPV